MTNCHWQSWVFRLLMSQRPFLSIRLFSAFAEKWVYLTYLSKQFVPFVGGSGISQRLKCSCYEVHGNSELCIVCDIIMTSGQWPWPDHWSLTSVVSGWYRPGQYYQPASVLAPRQTFYGGWRCEHPQVSQVASDNIHGYDVWETNIIICYVRTSRCMVHAGTHPVPAWTKVCCYDTAFNFQLDMLLWSAPESVLYHTVLP